MAKEAAGELVLKISTDSSEFSTGIQSAQATFASFSANVAKIGQGHVSSSMSSVASQFEGLMSRIQTGGISSLFEAVNEGLGSFVGGMGKAVGPVGAAAGAMMAALDGVNKKAKELSDNVANIGRQAKDLGETNQGTQILNRFFEQAGYSSSETTTAILRFQQRIGQARRDPHSDTGRGIGALGLDVDELASRSPQQQIEQLTVSLQAVRNRAERTDLERQIFGREFLDLDRSISNASGNWERARGYVRARGLDDDVINTAGQNSRDDRRRQQSADERGAAAQGFFESAAVGIRRAWNNAGTNAGNSNAGRFVDAWQESAGLLNGRRRGGPQVRALTLDEQIENMQLQFDAIRPGSPTTGPTADAIKLLAQWQNRSNELGGMSHRQAEINRLEGASVSPERLAELRAADEILTRDEKRLELEKKIKSIIHEGQTAYESYLDVLKEINNAREGNVGLENSLQADRLSGEAFLRLERSLPKTREGGPVGAVDARSAEALRIIATARIGQTPDDPVERVRRVLAAANEQRERHIKETQQLGAVLREVAPRPAEGI